VGAFDLQIMEAPVEGLASSLFPVLSPDQGGKEQLDISLLV
jgi:hypothetical protein